MILGVPAQLTVSGPEIEVLGNGLTIATGDGTPQLVDGSDFGFATVTGAPVSRTFSIRNPGASRSR